MTQTWSAVPFLKPDLLYSRGIELAVAYEHKGHVTPEDPSYQFARLTSTEILAPRDTPPTHSVVNITASLQGLAGRSVSAVTKVSGGSSGLALAQGNASAQGVSVVSIAAQTRVTQSASEVSATSAGLDGTTVRTAVAVSAQTLVQRMGI